ncbi:MAG: tRNA (cytidine(34)-2'-O)-methyltransferase [Pseudomonadales bacterium]
MDIVLYQPEIPPNTGNIIRLCANLGARLHLVAPLGFEMDDKRLRRAGLDYRDLAHVSQHSDWHSCQASFTARRWLGLSTKGQVRYTDLLYRDDDVLIFGPETRGLPPEVLQQLGPEQVLRIPMQPQSRSLNIANAVAVVAFESMRQRGFPGFV